MKVIFTGSRGSLGRRYLKKYPDTIGVSMRYEDMELYDNFREQLSDCDVVIHASANLNPSSVEESIRDNTLLTIDMLRSVEKINRSIQVILISSMSIMGKNQNIKKIDNMTDYAISKYMMEVFSRKFYKIPVTVVRFSTLFYEDHEKDGLSRIIYNAKKKEKMVAVHCKRDFIPIEIACSYLNKLCGNEKWFGKTINIASGVPIDMVDIGKYLKKKYSVLLHRTELPSFEDVCHKFDTSGVEELQRIEFDIYDFIDNYYDTIS